MLSLAHAGVPIVMDKWRAAVWGTILLTVFCTCIQIGVELGFTLSFRQSQLISYA